MRVPSRLLACLTILLSSLLIVPLQAQTAPGGPEKRIALVVGNAAYQAGALATPANDAGLVAQTLQAAGFDVVGARDLDEDSLRRALRDFTDKAAASGPDTVAFVYLAGYGLQLNGENYFAPIDARIDSAQDVPVRALRISDYKRRLAALPLKARFVVLDAGRSAPFVKSGDPLAGGLALTEAEPGMLVAYNAAPGTVGPDEKGPYGAYAQSLVEMIREGGLTPGDLFDRVRLRVSETTKGAEVPWDASKLETAFVFFQRAADAPPVEDPAKVAALRSKPLRDLGARDAYTACLQRDSIQSYQDFVSAYPSDAMAKRVRILIAARREALTWRRTYLADTPDGYWSYLSRYPRGPHAWDARRRLRELSVALAPPPHFAYLDYDLPPPPPDEIVYVERPAVYFADPYYDLPPPPPPPVYFLPPPPAYIVDLAPPPPVYVAYALPVPAFVPVPAYVSAPAYIAAPPNNVYFANIHNTTVINEINRQTVIEAHEPHGPSAAAIGAGAVAGAALGAAAARVALPPAVAQKAALLPNNGLPPGAAVPGGPAMRPGQFGGPTPNGQPGMPGQPAPGTRPALGQPLPGQNGRPLPQQANRPGLPGVGISPGQTPPAQPGLAGPNGSPQQATGPGQPQPGPRPPFGQPLPGQNGRPTPQQAARPDRPGQPPAGNPAGPVLGANGLPQQAIRPGQPGPVQAARPAQAPTGPATDTARQQALQVQQQQAAQQRAAAQNQQRQMMQQQAIQQRAAAQQQAAQQQAQQRQMMQQQQAVQQRQMMQQQQAAQQRAAAQAQQAQQRQMMQQQQAQAMAQQRQMMQQQAAQQRQMMAPRPQPQGAPPHGGCRPGQPCR